MREAKALAGLDECLGSHEPSLLVNAISTRLSCAGTLVFVAWMPYFEYARSEGSGGLQECLGLYEPSLLAVDVKMAGSG